MSGIGEHSPAEKEQVSLLVLPRAWIQVMTWSTRKAAVLWRAHSIRLPRLRLALSRN